ncbi:MAG: twin-arginine translocation signal domain-containing protein [Anaerolineales bacterium]|nr:twin-arginine translocation signal domain-containing protein [Anaerolineales bacterium]MDW8276545.1 twin-arginine translocation signal domain-containing protein [Anaerolineales bacterium]
MPASKLSRRDALKVLAAASGAVALSHLPTSWGKPELQAGVLPAHAQTSMTHVLSAPFPPEEIDLGQSYCYDGIVIRFTAVITPPTAGISLQYSLNYTASGAPGSITVPSPTIGTVNTNGSGQATVDVTVLPDSPFFGTTGTLTVVWSFVNPADGTNTVSQSYDIEIGC